MDCYRRRMYGLHPLNQINRKEVNLCVDVAEDLVVVVGAEVCSLVESEGGCDALQKTFREKTHRHINEGGSFIGRS